MKFSKLPRERKGAGVGEGFEEQLNRRQPPQTTDGSKRRGRRVEELFSFFVERKMLPLIDEEFLLIIYTVVLPEKISLYTGQKKKNKKQKATKCFVVLHLKTASFADAPIPIPVSGVNRETGVDCALLVLLKYEPIL